MKHCLLFTCILMASIVLGGCYMESSDSSERETLSLKENNEFFTTDLYKQLTEIDFWNGNEKVIIDNPEDIKSIYILLASLTLTETSSDIKDLKSGQTIINLVIKNNNISVGLLSDEISLNDKTYKTDADIVDQVRNIALGK